MRLHPHFPLPALPLLLAAGLLLLSLSGCGRHVRPASSLSEKDRATLARYEKIRAALVEDDFRSAKRAAADLEKFLKPTPESPATPLDASVHEMAEAPAMDKARTAFKTLSDSMVKLADGVEGYYIMDSPSPAGAEWVQTFTQVDNPYMGKAMRDVGSPHK